MPGLSFPTLHRPQFIPNPGIPIHPQRLLSPVRSVLIAPNAFPHVQLFSAGVPTPERQGTHSPPLLPRHNFPKRASRHTHCLLLFIERRRGNPSLSLGASRRIAEAAWSSRRTGRTHKHTAEAARRRGVTSNVIGHRNRWRSPYSPFCIFSPLLASADSGPCCILGRFGPGNRLRVIGSAPSRADVSRQIVECINAADGNEKAGRGVPSRLEL